MCKTTVKLEGNMQNYTIDEFWVPHLGTPSKLGTNSLVQGWSTINRGLTTFREAPLTLSTEEFGNDTDPKSSPVVLVSAPGAVGKSTLAREIAFRTGSVYIDLAVARPVGDNTLSGGLAKSKMYSDWENESITALIDGLDEATFKTTKEAFDAFLADIAEMSENRSLPTVLFGRTGAIQDAWLVLAELTGSEPTVLEIGYYSVEESLEFAQAHLNRIDPNRNHPSVDREALSLLLRSLRSQTETDGDRFAGYAPVLQAVAARVSRESNPSPLVSELKHGAQEAVTLHSVVAAILEREQGKLENLDLSDPKLAESLYTPAEQLDRLAAQLYQTPPPDLPQMSDDDLETYSNALLTWEKVHPFLNPESGASTVVFEAAICANALKSESTEYVALQNELRQGDAANPFLYQFYLGDELEKEPLSLPEKHVGVLYASLRAGLAHGDSASLFVGEQDDGDAENPIAEVEIEFLRRDRGRPTILRFVTGCDGPILLGSNVKDVTIVMPRARIEIGRAGADLVLVAPIEINCSELAIWAQRLIAENPSKSEAQAVLLEADLLDGTPISSVPVTRNGAELQVSWPDANFHPWNSFYVERSTVEIGDPRIDEGLRRLRKFVVEFRANRYGGLARSREKIDSTRMVKGTGQAILDAMLQHRIVTRDQSKYYLDTGVLGELTGANYGDCMKQKYGPKAIEFVRDALESNSD